MKKHYNSSLRFQLGFIVVSITTLLLVAFGITSIQSKSKMLEKDLLNSINSKTNYLAIALQLPIYNFDPGTQEALCKAIILDPNIIKVTLKANRKTKQFVDKESDRDIITLNKKVKLNGETIGEITVTASTQKLKRQITKYSIKIIILIILLDIILIGTIFFILTKLFIKPVTTLQNAAEKITNGDLNDEITLHNNNELGLLAQNLNTMRETLKEKVERLEDEIIHRTKTENELREAKQYIDDIINSMPSSLICINSKQKITQWNKQLERTTHKSPEEIMGADIYDIFPLLTEHQDKLQQVINKGNIQNFTLKSEHDNHTQYNDIKMFPLDAKGTKGAVIIIEETTEQHRLQQELAHSRKLDAIGQLAGGIAHDFNNMLGGILGGVELLALQLKKDNLYDKHQKMLDIIMTSAKRSATLTEQLLAFSRKGDNEMGKVNIIKIVKDAITLLEPTINKNVNVQLVINTENSTILGDYTQLQNVIINLGINASHAMPNGGTLTYTVDSITLAPTYCSASQFDISPGEFIKIEVNDTGEGISQENINKIFEPFFTTKPQGKGTGLGLAAVYGTVVQHHGSIIVYSEVGRGTSFHIYLPLADNETNSENNAIETKQESNTPTQKRGTVLVIDDEIVIRETAEVILEHLGYDVLLAENGKEGVDIFEKEKDKIDMIILDMVMPVMDGHECFYELKKIKATTPILLASGFSRGADIEQLKKDGLNGFIKKPYSTTELNNALNTIKKMEKTS